MSEHIVIDFTKELPFDISPWTVTTWDGDQALLGIRSNTITHSQKTEFEIRARFDYVKIEYIVSSETNYDKLSIYIDGSREVYTGTVSASFEKEFTDGNEHTVKFTYQKDGSGNSGYDAAFIKSMEISTVDDSITQYARLYGVLASDGKVYTLDKENNVVKVAETIAEMTKEKYFTFTSNKELINTESELFGNKKIICVSEQIQKEAKLRYKCLRKPDVLKMSRPFNLDYEYVVGISKISVDVTKSEQDIVRIVFSLDGGSSWVYIDKDGHMSTLPDIDRDNVLMYGNTPEEVMGFTTDALDQLYTTKSMMVAMVLKPDDLSSTISVNDITCKFKLNE